MDLITQGLLGGCLSQSVSRQSQLRQASLIGFLSGMLADADVLIRSNQDPLLSLEYHRHFTHALIFIPFGALLAAVFIALLIPPFRRNLGFAHIYMYSLAGYSLSGFLDACTSYGTHLFWPLTDARVAWNLISIVDPVFTGFLLLGFIFAWRRRSRFIVCVSLILAASYLVFGWLQHERAANLAYQLASERNHKVERLRVKPTLGNLILWRSLYETETANGEKWIYVDAIRVGIAGKDRIYPGEGVRLFVAQHDIATVIADQTDQTALRIESVLYQDIQRFSHFSDHYLGLITPDNAANFGFTEPVWALADLRYATLPNSLRPMWVLRFDPHKPDQHGTFRVNRKMDASMRQQFLHLLRGKGENTESEQSSR